MNCNEINSKINANIMKEIIIKCKNKIWYDKFMFIWWYIIKSYIINIDEMINRKPKIKSWSNGIINVIMLALK